MKEQVKDKRSKQQMRNMRFSEDRFQLFDTIRTIVNDELERHGVVKVKQEGNPHPENYPLEKTEHQPSEKTSPCRTLWKRMVSLFTFCLIE
ncbi:MAG: hypothetical protein ACTTKI_02290 [Tannerella sp.]|uniref:hypothetical protein n=1 Tax=Tannerella sp. TaxID=2382127 RepID=UPI003FA236AB